MPHPNSERTASTAPPVSEPPSRPIAHPELSASLAPPLSAPGLAHDINNLLLVLQNTVESVWPATDSPAEREAVETIRLAVAKARVLACDIMEADSHCRLLKPIPTEPNALVNAFRPLLRAIVAKNVRLDIRLASDVPAIKVDRDGFCEILLNLVKNASEAFSGRKGEIAIETAELDLNHDQLSAFSFRGCVPLPGSGALFTVRDNGPGIDLALLDEVAERRLTTKTHGHGIGLANVVALVKAAGGGICIRTSPNKGFCFNIWIPATSDKAVEEAAPREPARRTFPARSSKTRPLRVLLLDDDPAILQSSSLLLASMHAEPILADTQNTAFQLFMENQRNIDLVFLDANVDRMSTLPLLERFRQLDPEIPCIIVSGYTESRIRCIFKQDLYNGFLGKPYTRSDMENILSRFANAP